MKALLLYPDREWEKPEFYFDEKNIVKDLGLEYVFTNASQQIFFENGEAKRLSDADIFIKDVMHKVILTPLTTKEEIEYRQKIISDCIKAESFINGLYATSSKMLSDWEKLGRRVNNRNFGRDNSSKLVSRIHEFRLFLDTLNKIRDITERNCVLFSSEGLNSFARRLRDALPDALMDKLYDISGKISFYVSEINENNRDINPTIDVPKAVLECGISGDLRLENFKLEELETVVKKYRNPKSTVAKVQTFIDSRVPDSVACDVNQTAKNQTARLEYEIVRYVMSFVEPFMKEYENFFDALKFQTAFYVGAVNLTHQIKRFKLEYCFPCVCEKNTLRFEDLKEYVMCIGQRVDAVGNTCSIDSKSLIIITGANQGGKSTFLRSIGIAQVMMQAGLPVTAKSFQSGIFPSLFMHFTRREDSQMNSGRLDEELSRMDQIIRNLGPDSLILLNESFATTTERDGSEICYDIIKALHEAGVRIISVTHLLSFAQRIYAESSEAEAAGKESKITFFTAERLENGKRTYRMIQNVPELTSFGLDLYEKVIGNCDGQ